MAKKLARTVSVPAITVESILATKISEIEKLPCECTNGTDELGEVITNTCDRCKQLEELRNKCVCGKCDDCLRILLEYHKTQQCKCTYKTIQVEETIINEQGLEEVILVDRDAVDVMCERCKTILSIGKQLEDRKLMRDAYIDEVDFDKYEIVDGIIKNKVAEKGIPSDVENLKTQNDIQDELITTTMLATAEVNEQVSNTDTMTTISLQALAELNEQLILMQEEINKLKGGVTA